MPRFVVAFAVAVSLFASAAGCGTHEPAQATPDELEVHRKQMEDISARERGG